MVTVLFPLVAARFRALIDPFQALDGLEVPRVEIKHLPVRVNGFTYLALAFVGPALFKEGRRAGGSPDHSA